LDDQVTDEMSDMRMQHHILYLGVKRGKYDVWYDNNQCCGDNNNTKDSFFNLCVLGHVAMISIAIKT
jgi:hypothetical protein